MRRSSNVFPYKISICAQNLQTMSQDAVYEIPLYLDYWFTRRRALHVFPLFTPMQMKSP